MKKLTISRKLTLLGLLFMIPFATVTYMMVSSIRSEKVDFANLELMGAAYDAPVSALLQDLQDDNCAATAWLSGDDSFADTVAKKKSEIEADVARVDDADQQFGTALRTTPLWQDLRTKIEALLHDSAQLSAPESLLRHQALIDATTELITKVSDNSKLTLDPDIDSYYLMNIVMFQGPETTNFLSQARSLGCQAAASRTLTPGQKAELLRSSTLADYSWDGVTDSFGRACAFNSTLAPEMPEAKPLSTANDATARIRTLATDNLAGRNPQEVYADMGLAVGAMFTFEDQARSSLQRLLQLRAARWQDEIDLTLGAATVGLLSVLIIGFLIARDITVPLQRVVGIANEIANGTGDYSIRAAKRSDDELGKLVDAFNQMLKQIEERDVALEKRVAERTEDVLNSLSLVTATLESTTDGIVVTGADGTPTSYNGKFLEMWKIPGEEPGGDPRRTKRRSKSVTSPLSSDYSRFLYKVNKLLAHPEEETFDQIQLKDGRLFEQYSKPQRIDNKCVGRVWSFRDITERKRAEKEMLEMHQQLVDTSRQAGMAEVATSVLHNVGNVLNSVNVSCSVVATLLKKSKVENLFKVVEMFTAHAGDLGRFLADDPKGRQLPGYLSQLSQHLLGQQGLALQELDRLQDNIDHIKDIVVMQQGYAKISGAVENLSITSLLEDALRLNLCSLQRHGVEVIRQYEDVEPIEVEKHKILQILVNLIRNAKHACDEARRTDKKMTLSVTTGQDRVAICVSDNGVGIPPENLNRIFSHGFTTKKEGHGFGLHSAALAAKEMGGALSVTSGGVGCGAAFTLELPYRPAGTTAPRAKKNPDPACVA